MAASTRARAPRTHLRLETLEGRAAPASGFSPPVLANPDFAAPALTVTNGSVAAPPAQAAGQTSMHVVSRIYVNGELVMTVRGRPQFTGIGTAASGDQNGSTEAGGITVFANGQAVGTFQNPPTVTRDVSYVTNKNGQPVKLVTYHVNAVPYMPPVGSAAAAGAFGGPFVG